MPPLVSVIVRSMDRRPTLDEALASLTVQIHPRLEALVVNARGGQHSPLPDGSPGRDFRLIGQGGTPLGRAAACNAGLQAVKGEWVLFLDDDDLLLPDHITRLLAAVTTQSSCRAAYAGVRVEGGDEVYDHPYDKAALLAANFLPIHAVLFAHSLIGEGCTVSTELPLFEDWDFWLQIACRTDFLHVSGVSAIYRRALGSSQHGRNDIARHAALRIFYRRWHARADADWWAAAAVLLDQQREALLDSDRNLAEQEVAAREAREAALTTLQQREQQCVSLQNEVDHLRQALAHSLAQMAAMQSATTWRMTAPLRALVTRCRKLRSSER